MNTILGFRVHVIPDAPRYTLPPELLPGVPWPVGFRDEFNAWARPFLGHTNLMHDGEIVCTNGSDVFMNPRTVAALKLAANDAGGGGLRAPFASWGRP